MTTLRDWYRVHAQADGLAADLYVYDSIGASWFDDQAVTAKKFIDDVRALPESVKTLRVHVNSPGGDVFDAVAIANALRTEARDRKRTIEMHVEGLAASAATVITSAGDTISIADNALMMVHNPAGLVMGTAADMLEMAALLGSVRDSIIATYRWVSHLGAEAIGALMDKTTWMNAEEAVANGFATEVVPGKPVTARFRPEGLKALGEIPAGAREALAPFVAERPKPPAPVPAPKPEPEPQAAAAPVQVLKLCREADAMALAEPLIEARATEAEVKARTERAKEIRALCAVAKLPELAAGYIKDDLPPATVRSHLTTITARLAKAEIDGQQPPDPGAAGVGHKTAADIYAQRRLRLQKKGA